MFFSLAVLFPLSGPARAADLWTYHNDTARTGWNQAETILSPADVNAGGFGKLFSDAVDGQVYAQPLYASGVTVNGAVRNVVYVVTEHDSAYAFDADAAGVTLWHDNFTGLLNGVTVTTVSAQADLNGCAQITPEVGITDTPVLDLSNGTLYFVAFTKEVSAGPATAFVHRLHALDMATGAERPGSPVSIAADVTGQFPGGAAGDVFEARPLKERSGLLLENGVVYISFSSHCDDPSLSAVQNYHGWAMGYDADTLRQTAALNVTPYGGEGSIWGGAPLADAGGNIYMGIGNGSFDPPNHNWGDSILRLDASLGVQGYFTPSNQQTLNDNDWDVASVGLALLPPSFGNASHPNLITGGNKSGTVYLMDAADLGGYAGTLAGTPTPSAAPPDNIVQEFQPVGPAADLFFGIPACFSDGASNYVYWSFNGQPLSAYTLAGAQYDTTASSRTAETYPYPGCVPSVSSNGTSNGIVWTLQMNGSNPAVLHAYDATNLANELYNSGQNPSRDQAAPGVKWAPPSVVNGKVYVPTSNSLVVYGLLTAPSTTPTSPPQLSIPTATFTPAPSDTPTPSPTSANDLYAQWVQATADAASGQRVNHQALWFNNRLWVIGGSALVPSGNFQDVNDVWSSTDGSNWTQATASAAFPAREGFGAVTFNNQMWVLGGVNTNGTSQVSYNDAWSSSDGVSWTQAASAAPWIARSGLTATVFNGRIWVIGGYDNSANTLNDVWSSSDGVNWTQAAASAAFSTRAYHETVSWNGQLWLLGGEDEFGDQFNDVWSSSDGSNWTQAATAPWAARSEQSGLVFQNQLFVIGGWDEAQGEALNDVYHSSDGVNWTLSTSAAPFPSRYEAPAVTDGSRIWVLQGQNTAQTLSDAWFSPPTALSPTPSPTGNTALPTSTPTASPTASPTPSPSGTPTLSPTGTPSPTGTSTPTGISTSGTVPATPTWTPTATLPPAPSVTPAPTPTSGGDLYAQWAQATADAASNQRVNHQALWFNNRLWVIGGNALNSAGTFQDANDVWSSPDGSNWTRATASAAFPAREGFGAVVFNNQMWVLGGADHNNGSSQRYNDVWSSSDGVNWTQATAAAPWAARSGLGAAVLNGRIWVIAGTDASGSALNDAWSSPDGANWTQATSAAAFPRRTYHQAAAWNNRLWVLNGHNEVGEQFNDIWSSPDGAAWTPVETGPWSKRSEGSAVVFQGQLFIIGGWNEAQGTALNDVYHSSDGVNWTLSTSAAPFPPRYQAPAVADGNRIWVLQGQNTTQTLSDAWYSPAAATALVTPVTSPSTTTALSASTPTASPTASPTTTPTFTATRTSTPGATGTSPATGTSTPTAMASPSSTDSATPSPSPASTAASSPTASPTSTPSATPTLTATPSPTATPTPTPSPTAFPAIQPTPTPLPVCIGNGGLTSPKLNLQMACSSLGSQSQDFTVKITNEGAQPVTLADLSVVVWLNESGAENMDQFTATAGQTCGPGGFPCNNVVLSGQATSHGPVAACAGAPGHSANQAVTFNFGSGSTFTLPPNGGYYQSQNGELRFGRNNPSMDGGTWSDDYSHLGSGTGCPDSAFHDSPFYALLDNGQLVQETADTAGTLDPATGMVPCQTPVTYGTPLSPPQPYTPAALVEGGTPVAANLFTAPVLYPNPYRGAQKTTLQITLSRTSDISVEFLTVAYHEVSRKVFNGVPEGVQNLPLDAVDDGGSPLANGLYYVVMMATPTNGGRAQKFVGKWLILR